MVNTIEKLENAILTKNSRIMVGLDPRWEDLPKKFYHCEIELNEDEKNEILIKYCSDFISAVADLVPAIKINSAFFETNQMQKEYFKLAKKAKKLGLIVIGDLKICSMGQKSEDYAHAYLDDISPFDAITIQPYYGIDGIKPFVKTAVKNTKSVFVVVKTANDSSYQIQNLVLEDERKIYEEAAGLVKYCGDFTKTSCNGYNSVGADLSITHKEEAESLRKQMKNSFLLISDFNKSEQIDFKDLAVNFDSNGLGAVVDSSESLKLAYKKPEYEEKKWTNTVRSLLKKQIQELNDEIKKCDEE